MAQTVYDELAYPTSVFSQTQPDRMALIARLAGMDPAPLATARVLEIGVGDGMNLIALAAAWPDAEFVGFDLAATAIEKGQAWIAATGLTNVRLETLDLLEAGDRIDGPFDYIIAHGFYAWVPPHVRDATMAFIEKMLAPQGVAFVSYNTLPGCYVRMAVRDALRFAVGDERDPARRRELAEAQLRAIADRGKKAEFLFQSAVREAAASALEAEWHVLAHDELGAEYHPQRLTDVTDAAAAHGLRFLGDAGRERLGDGFLIDALDAGADIETTLLRHLQQLDYLDSRAFRQTLLVRAEARPARRLDDALIAPLYASSRSTREDATRFRNVVNVFEVGDPVLAEALGTLIDAMPRRVRVSDLVDTADHRVAFFGLFDAALIDLHVTPEPYCSAVSDRPCASRLTRAMIDHGFTSFVTLDQRFMKVPEEGARRLVSLLDGTRTLDDLAGAGHEAGLADRAALQRGLALLAREAVLIA